MLFKSNGVPEHHIKVMEEEVMYWINQAHETSTNNSHSQIDIDVDDDINYHYRR